MSVDPRGGKAYAGPSDLPSPTEYPYDGVPVEPAPRDDGYIIRNSRNPDGADAGPLFATPEADRWLQENVSDRGLVIDWGTREIFDPQTGEVKGTVPKFFPKMS